jgi:hypothetical protein
MPDKQELYQRLRKAITAHLEGALHGGLDKELTDEVERRDKYEELMEEVESAADALVDLVLESPELRLSDREVQTIGKAADMRLALCEFAASDVETDQLRFQRLEVFERHLLILLHGL